MDSSLWTARRLRSIQKEVDSAKDWTTASDCRRPHSAASSDGCSGGVGLGRTAPSPDDAASRAGTGKRGRIGRDRLRAGNAAPSPGLSRDNGGSREDKIAHAREAQSPRTG